MKKKYWIIFGSATFILVIGMLFLLANEKPDLCAWSDYENFYTENSGWEFCCELPVDENGEYGFKEDGSRISNKCQATQENER